MDIAVDAIGEIPYFYVWKILNWGCGKYLCASRI
jgi:hypothetical protein